MASPSVIGMQDNMTALKMKLLQQKLSDEKDRLNSPGSDKGDKVQDENVKLQLAILRRRELLDKLKQEETVGGVYPARPHSSHHYPPPRPPPSRISLPDLSKQKELEMPVNRQIIEHQITPRAYYLPPVQHPPPPQPPPQPVILQQPYQPPQVVSLQPPPEQKGSSWNKGDFIEMMMMQNVQMHQMVMQQMMLSSLPGNKPNATPPQAPPPPVVQQPPPPPPPPQPLPPQPVLHIRDREVPPGAPVHHHHYSMPFGYRQPPLYRPPQVQHYTLPPIDVRSRHYPERNLSVMDNLFSDPYYDDRDYIYR